mgnify:CR=1 FL=1|jgi:hypothetical protein
MAKVEKEIPVVVPDDDPNRCKGMANGSQCHFKAIEGGEMCIIHGGNTYIMSANKKNIYDLRKTRYLQDFKRMSENSFWRSNREEVGILRVVLQDIISKCESTNDIYVNASRISEIVSKINKLLETSLKIDEKLKALITEEKMYEIAQLLVDAVYDTVQDPLKCAEIASKFEKILTESREY